MRVELRAVGAGNFHVIAAALGVKRVHCDVELLKVRRNVSAETENVSRTILGLHF